MVGFLFISCSKEDLSDDIIIGKWQPFEMYDNDTQVDLPTCISYMFTEYKNDQTFYSGFISTDLPDECKSIDFSIGWTWKNLGNNQYAMKLGQERPEIYVINKRDQNLFIENLAENKIIVYKPI